MSVRQSLKRARSRFVSSERVSKANAGSGPLAFAVWPPAGSPVSLRSWWREVTARGLLHADPPDFPEEMFHRKVLPLANETGASRVILETDGGLVVATLNQWRYWTPSRARLCAAEILRRHMAVFEE